MKNSLERATEEFFIQLFKSHPVLKKKQFRHYDESRQAEQNCIVVEAEQGNHRLDGPRGFDVEVTAVYRSPTTVTPAANDLVAAAMVEAVHGARPRLTTAEQNFGYLMIMDEMSGNRSNTNRLRRREKKFTVLARLKDVPENALSR